MMTIKDLDFVRRVSNFGGKFRGVPQYTSLQLAVKCYKVKKTHEANRRLYQRNNKSK